jgi:phosphoglycerol transferase MdoB-like AlkP superfamily enzyme
MPFRSLRQNLASLLKYYACLLVMWVLAFAFFRLVLVVATWNFHGNATSGLLLKSFLHGLRFDFSMAVRICAAFALWRTWRPVMGPLERRIFFGVFSVVALIAFFTLTAEVEYYKEFQMRIGPLALEYFGKPEDNKIIAGMIWHGYPVVRWTLFCLAVWAAFLWLTRSLVMKDSGDSGWFSRLLATGVMALVTAFGSRGGFQSAPLRWGDAFFSQNTYANHMAQNGLFALVDTLRTRNKSQKSDAWGRGMPFTNAVAILRQSTLLPGETLVNPDKYPLLRRSSPAAPPLVQKPKNVVLVLMESFSARFCGATGAKFGATPNFDEIARHGILFDHAFSVSTHTAQGVFGTLCSFPNLPEFDGVMKHPLGNQPFRTLPTILKESGFNILFLYNGLYSWDNKEGFFRQQGVERFIGRNDYVNPTFVDPDWGVCDFDVFVRAVEEFNALGKTGKPFFGFVLTLSNHAPFNLPKVEGLEQITLGEEQNTRINGIHYADWALGQFIQRARKTDWFKDTLFVFAGDHGFGIPPVLTRAGLLHQHIPLLFYGPGVLGETGEVRHVTASQIDILPSIHGILGLEVAHQSFGRNLFALPPGDTGRAYVKASGSPIVGLIEGNQIATVAAGQPVVLQTFDLSFPPSASDDIAARQPERAAQMEKHLKAFVQTGLKTLKDHRAGGD